MALRIEDYAIIGDLRTAALVGRDGSIDWLCLPRFDSGACFASLLGKPDNGQWLIAPQGEVLSSSRSYRDGTLVLETRFATAEGEVSLIDCMPPRTREADLVRLVVGRKGRVPMHTKLTIRTDYGSTVPWVRRMEGGIHAIAGPDTIGIQTPIELHGENLTTVGEFTVAEGETVPMVLTWCSSVEVEPNLLDAKQAVRETETWWREWSSRCTYEGPYRDAVVRSLITLKALTYEPTGGIVAAATTSLPEQIGSVRNWDYRYCWVRDATFTLYALLTNGYMEEAIAWREWLLRAVAGTPSQLNIMYGLAGERRLTEIELDWLDGYEQSRPVRIGNAAHRQFQLDVFGEVMAALNLARRLGIPPSDDAWRVQAKLIEHLESDAWKQPDEGIWEVRGPRRHFTHSKVMAWVAVDQAVKAIENWQVEGPLDRWRALRKQMHDDICRQGFNAEKNSFVQSYGASELDASLLMIPLVGFLPAHDARVRGTLAAIERELLVDGFVQRYRTETNVDHLPAGEGVFLACNFWLVDNLHVVGRHEEAVRLFEQLLELRNDVGLLAEEYDPHARRQLGNFPQAFSHVGLVNSARLLAKKPEAGVKRTV